VIIECKPTAMAALRSSLHSQCILCGTDHPQGLRLAFNTHADGHVEAFFACDRLYQGYSGRLHGGVIAALLDSAMTNCLFGLGRVAVTGELKVRFLKPIIVCRPAIVSARLAESLAPLFKMSGEVCQNGEIRARATAKFMEVPISDSGLAPEGRMTHRFKPEKQPEEELVQHEPHKVFILDSNYYGSGQIPMIMREQVEKRVAEFVESCRREGVKVTHQRTEIFRELAGTEEHPDAETIYAGVRKRIPAMSLDTMYRTLRMLEGKGVISRAGSVKNRTRFDANTDRHHHFVCSECGFIGDFCSDVLNRFPTPAEVSAMGCVDSVYVELRGRCRKCQAKGRKSK